MEPPTAAGSTTMRPSMRLVLPSKRSMAALETNTTLFSPPGRTRNSPARAATVPLIRNPSATRSVFTEPPTAACPRDSVEQMELQHRFGEVAAAVVDPVVEARTPQQSLEGQRGPPGH